MTLRVGDAAAVMDRRDGALVLRGVVTAIDVDSITVTGHYEAAAFGSEKPARGTVRVPPACALPERALIIGAVGFWYGDVLLTESVQHCGEKPDGPEVYERAKRALETLRLDLLPYLPAARRKAYVLARPMWSRDCLT